MGRTKQALEAVWEYRTQLGEKLKPKTKTGLAEAEALITKNLAIRPKELDVNHGYFVCQVCGFTVGYTDDYKSHKYCLNCGQKMDWRKQKNERGKNKWNRAQ